MVSNDEEKSISKFDSDLRERLKTLPMFEDEPLDQEGLEKQRQLIIGEKEYFLKTISKMESNISDWGKYINSLFEKKDDHMAKEESFYFDVLIDPENSFSYMNTLIRARDALVMLQERLKFVEKTLEKKRLEKDSKPIFMPLPEIPLQHFNGNVRQWNFFWNCFSTCVHETNIPDAQKFLRLLNALEGPAKEAIRYLRPNEDYRKAIRILRENYGNQDKLREAIYRDLYTLPVSSRRLSDINKTALEVVTILRYLESLNEVIDHYCLFLIILRKFPRQIVSRLLGTCLRSRRKGKFCDMKSIRDELLAIVNDNDYVLLLRSGDSGDEATNSSNPSCTSNVENQNLETEQTKSPCVFCNGLHFNNQCEIFRTVEARKGRAMELNLCFKCLGVNHTSKYCNTTKRCYYCKRGHNTAFCFQKFEA